MSHGRFKNPVEAVLAGIKDPFRKQPLAERFDDSVRLDGKTCLVTGANSGLGFAVSVLMAERGAEVIMACRSGIPEAGDAVRKKSGSEQVVMEQVDLSDLDQIHNLADRLKDRGVQLDAVVCNAGVTPPKARQTAQGLEEMFTVNYLAKYLLLDRLLGDGTLPNNTRAGNALPQGQQPRVIFVSSDSHQGASAIDWEEFGHYRDYGVKKAINNYSYFKLLMNTFAVELSRRFRDETHIDVQVFPMCPGPVNTNIIRSAPQPLRGFLRLIFRIFFQSPEKAAKPIVYLAASDDVSGQTCRYLHMFRDKKMDPKCYDEAEGRKLWEESLRVLEAHDRRKQPA